MFSWKYGNTILETGQKKPGQDQNLTNKKSLQN